ncbi:PglZ domain-containing protein [Candidatus Poribacteria bacterium]|nr:PglZ domain-containing protein [Candidatus Poribacteria bacterium]
MQEKKWRILWIDNQIADVEQSDAQLKNQHREEQTNITSKPYICFLEYRGYDISLTNTIAEGIASLQNEEYHAVLLNYNGATREENPLSYIRKVDAHIPIILLTQDGRQEVLQQASLYDVDSIFIETADDQDETSSRQLETSLAFILEKQTGREAYTPQAYAQHFNRAQISDGSVQGRSSTDDWQTWIDTYVRLVEWDLRLDTLHNVDEIKSIHEMEKREANAAFADYIQANYHKWLVGEASPTLSVDVVYRYVIPEVQAGKQVLFVVMDCMRLDHWLKIEPLLYPLFNITTDYYYSILPTATRYARNAIFSGLFPLEFAERHPDLYAEPDTAHTSINRYEKELMRLQLERHGILLKPPLHYFKIFDTRGEIQYLHWLSVTDRISLTALVVDFLDMLTHTRHEIGLLQQLVPDEAAFRTLAQAWFQHSHLYRIFRIAAERGMTVVLTSDHGSLLCQNAAKVSSQAELTTGLRFKEGKNISCLPEAGWVIKEPGVYRLPGEETEKSYVLAKEDYYFVYERQFDVYKEIFQGSFQHGGVSLEEMILPCVVLEPR